MRMQCNDCCSSFFSWCCVGIDYCNVVSFFLQEVPIVFSNFVSSPRGPRDRTKIILSGNAEGYRNPWVIKSGKKLKGNN